MRILRKIVYELFTGHTKTQGYLCHLPHGIFTVVAAVYAHWVIALLFGIGFCIYEINQEWHYSWEGDKAHQDIGGWLLGMVIGGLVYSIFLR